MKSTCLVCFTVELNSETLYIFNILRNHEVLFFLDINQLQILQSECAWRGSKILRRGS